MDNEIETYLESLEKETELRDTLDEIMEFVVELDRCLEHLGYQEMEKLGDFHRTSFLRELLDGVAESTVLIVKEMIEDGQK